MGSLVTAVASFLHARQARGEWLVRIEDIDPPREVPGAADEILRTLEAFELEWDRPVLYQSSPPRCLSTTVAQRCSPTGRAFRCRCSRSEMRAANEDDVGALPRHLPRPAGASRRRRRCACASIPAR